MLRPVEGGAVLYHRIGVVAELHVDMGRQEPESTAHGMDYTVNPIEGLELADQLHDCLLYTSDEPDETTQKAAELMGRLDQLVPMTEPEQLTEPENTESVQPSEIGREHV